MINPQKLWETADYKDDLVLLANKPAQAEFLLHNQEPAVEGIISKQIKQSSYVLNKNQSPLEVASFWN